MENGKRKTSNKHVVTSIAQWNGRGSSRGLFHGIQEGPHKQLRFAQLPIAQLLVAQLLILVTYTNI